LLAEAIAVGLDSIYTFVPDLGDLSILLDQKHCFQLTFWVFLTLWSLLSGQHIRTSGADSRVLWYPWLKQEGDGKSTF